MLFGRDAETSAIERLLDAAREGSGSAVVVRGEAGIGKSSLMALARQRAEGFTVLEALGLQAESELPFAALADLARPVLRALEELPDRQAAALEGALALGPPAAGDRFAVAAATLSLLAAAADEQPLLVLVDDAHWVDPASREAMLFAARRLSADPIALIFAIRDGETDAFDDVGLPEILVGALDPASAGLLVGDISVGRAAEGVNARLVEATGGNPLALIEVTGNLSDEQLTGAEELDPELLEAETVEKAFLRRAARLSDEAQRALLIAAAGTSDSAEEVEAACGLVGVDPGALSEAEAAGLITRNASFEFRHSVLRSAVYRAATGEQREAAHGALARALTARDPSERRAWHYASAARGPDAGAAAALREVGAAARARGALSAAARAFERAAELTSNDGERAQWLFDAATDRQLTGSSARARELLAQASESVGDPLLRADIEHLYGQIEMWGGETPEAHRRLEAAGGAVEPVDRRRAAIMLSDGAFSALLSGDIPTGTALARRAHTIALTLGPEIEALTAGALANGMLLAGDLSAVPLLDAYDAIPLERLTPPALFQALPPLTWIEQYDRVRALVLRMTTMGRASSAPSILVPALFNLTELEFRSGDWDAAYVAGSEAVSLSRDASGQLLHLSLVVLARVEAGRGLEEPCRAHAEEGLKLAGELADGSALAYGLGALGLLELGLGRVEAAVEALATLDDALRGMGVTNPAVVMSLPDLIEAHVRAGDAEAAAAALERFVERAPGGDLVWPRAAAARCRGLLADDAGYEACFEEALALHDGLEQRFERARTELCFGERLRRARRVSDARERLRSALDVFERLGATPWADRARLELDATGERRRARGPETGELTPRELQVAMLVARGATNREAAATLFLTAKTIEYHLGQIYRKLDIRSRTELANRLAAPDPEASTEVTSSPGA